MVETLLIECAKAFGKLFINPMFYWMILLAIGTGYERVLQERLQFGFKIFNVFSEMRNTWTISLVFGILISGLTLGAGMVLTYETILIMSIVVIALSITFNLTMLSASYTIGLTYLIILISLLFLGQHSVNSVDLLSRVNFTGLIILLGIFLIVEALLISKIKRNETLPKLAHSERGVWIGQQHIKKLSIIPFFVLVPTGLISPFASFWPFFSLGDDSTYSLMLVPFILGFDFVARRNLSMEVTASLAKQISLLGLFVLSLGIGSTYIPWLSIIGVLIAILGREYINYRHRVTDKAKSAYFNKMDQGLKVLAIIPGSPADRLGILVGETVSKVNDQIVTDGHQFYKALQNSGAFFKLSLIDDNKELRFVQSAFYDNDHHKLGIVFTDKPYRDYEN